MATLETLEMSGTGDGNNKIPRAVPGAHWCFTWNNYSEEDLATLETNFKKEIKTNKLFQYLFSREVGEKCGTPHLQGWISTGDPKIKIRPNEKFKTMKNGINLVRWEKTKGSKEDNVKYCTKSGGEMHSNVTLLKDPLKGLELYEYQKEILDLINTEPDNRSIYWYWEQTGNLGKTTLAKHICMNHKALYVNGKAADIKSAIVTELKEGRDAPKIVLFGYPRTSEDYVSYASLEEVKDGLFFSGKYESGMCIFNPPHVIVFANFMPDESKLSKDRWIVRHIRPEEVVKEEEERDPVEPYEGDIDEILDDEWYEKIEKEYNISRLKGFN